MKKNYPTIAFFMFKYTDCLFFASFSFLSPFRKARDETSIRNVTTLLTRLDGIQRSAARQEQPRTEMTGQKRGELRPSTQSMAAALSDSSAGAETKAQTEAGADVAALTSSLSRISVSGGDRTVDDGQSLFTSPLPSSSSAVSPSSSPSSLTSSAVTDWIPLLIIGATNRPNAIDNALRRPGRFDVEVEVRTGPSSVIWLFAPLAFSPFIDPHR